MKIQTKLKYYYWKTCIINALFGNNKTYKKTDNKRVWIFLGADYGNLGDVAITLVQEEFLKRNFREFEIVTIPISKTLEAIPQVKRVIKADDIITIVGGGNISNLYEDIEFLRQRVIRSFPNNKIISFPQSIHLTEGIAGEEEKHRIAKIYGVHKNLLILMRDRVSYGRMKEIIPDANIELAPDIVMSADYRRNLLRKKQVLVCLRHDKEASDKNATKTLTLIRAYQEHGYEIIRKDTQIEDRLVKEEGGKYHLESFLNEVSSSAVMITNRLHGMIFAFITGTPAIIIDNSTGKVSSTYDWIKDCGYIFRLEDLKESFLDPACIKDNSSPVNLYINKLLSEVINT